MNRILLICNRYKISRYGTIMYNILHKIQKNNQALHCTPDKFCFSSFSDVSFLKINNYTLLVTNTLVSYLFLPFPIFFSFSQTFKK